MRLDEVFSEFMEEYESLFKSGKVWNPNSSKARSMLKKLRSTLSFPFPLLTGSSRDGIVDVMLIHPNMMPSDSSLAEFVEE